MKYLLILIMATGLFAGSCKITYKKDLGNDIYWGTAKYTDFCIDGYVWRYFEQGKRGSLSQVFENKGREKYATAKECSCD